LPIDSRRARWYSGRCAREERRELSVIADSTRADLVTADSISRRKAGNGHDISSAFYFYFWSYWSTRAKGRRALE